MLSGGSVVKVSKHAALIKSFGTLNTVKVYLTVRIENVYSSSISHFAMKNLSRLSLYFHLKTELVEARILALARVQVNFFLSAGQGNLCQLSIVSRQLLLCKVELLFQPNQNMVNNDMQQTRMLIEGKRFNSI